MALYLKEVDVVPEVRKFQSALIVVCRFCPAASVAVRKQQPYVEFFRRLLKTESFEQLISNMQSRLEREGLRTSVFKGNLLNFITCMWTSGQRKRLMKRAQQCEAVVVMGCEGAYNAVCNTTKSIGCHVFRGMESEGVLDATPKFHLPFNVSLELTSVTPILFQEKQNGMRVSS